VAFVIHLLAVLIEAICFATSCKEIFFGGALGKNVHEAFNLLGGRPVDLSILLEALLGFHTGIPVVIVHLKTFLVLVLTSEEKARVPLTVSSLAFGLKTITLSVLLNVLFVR
jgi:hypothetical protein